MIVGRALAVASVLLVSLPAAAQESESTPATARYSYIVAGQLAGHYERTKLVDGSYRFRLEYRAGSGHVAFDMQMEFDERWFPLRLHTSGHDASGQDVAETFVVEGGIARWKSRIGSGTAFAGPIRFYSSATPSFDEIRALVLAARTSRDGCVELLPIGRACVRKATESRIAVREGESTVHAWAVSGISSRPLLIWLDDKGDLFASVTAWSSAILEGWESLEDQLLDAQDRWLEQEAVRRAGGGMKSPSGSVARSERPPLLR